MSGQHTPGPYSIHPYSTIQARRFSKDGSYEHAALTIGAGDKVIGEVRFSTHANGYPAIDTEDEMRAVAALWIAAPELLEAAKEGLQALIGVDRLLHQYGMMEGVDCPAIETLRAAIAKAEGRS